MASVFLFPFTMYAIPLATNIVPSVAINGGSLNFPTKYPLIIPITRQLNNAISIASIGLIPPVIKVAAIIALIPTIDPIDRSIFPVINT